MAKFKSAFVIEYADFDKMVKELYGIDFKFMESIPDELIGHYTYHEFDVDGESELDLIFDDVIVERWIDTGEWENIRTYDFGLQNGESYWNDYAEVEAKHIFHRMIKDGHIQPGKYFILVDW